MRIKPRAYFIDILSEVDQIYIYLLSVSGLIRCVHGLMGRIDQPVRHLISSGFVGWYGSGTKYSWIFISRSRRGQECRTGSCVYATEAVSRGDSTCCDGCLAL